MEQWFLRITDYAEELLKALDGLEGRWPDDCVVNLRGVKGWRW